MSRITLYTEALQLDNFLQVLTPFERILTSQYRTQHAEQVPKMVQLLSDWVAKNNWQPPKFLYNDKRELLYKENGEWFPITKHELYRAEIIYKI